jgi:hypothetical protein
MLGALARPVSITPTLLYLAGVPGDLNPFRRSNFTLTADIADGANAARASPAIAVSSVSRRRVVRFESILAPSPWPGGTAFVPR